MAQGRKLACCIPPSLQYRIKRETALSPASPLLRAKLKALDKLPGSLSRSPTTQIHHFLSYFRRLPPPLLPLVYTGFHTIRTKICIYIYIGFARPRTKHFAHNRLNREAQLGTIEKNREIQAGLLGERRVGEDLGARIPLLLISILFYFFPLF